MNKYEVIITPKPIVQIIEANNKKEAELEAVRSCFPEEAFDWFNPSMVKVNRMRK